MAIDKVVDSTALEAGLTQIAIAIREKGGTTDALAFPDAMAAAITAIEAGGGGVVTGSFTQAETFNIYSKAYTVSDRAQYNGILYKCVQAHTSQADWTPNTTPALWVVVSIDEYPEWVQPTGAQDAYAKEAKVTHNGERWISNVDANVWEPGVYGWTKEV